MSKKIGIYAMLFVLVALTAGGMFYATRLARTTATPSIGGVALPETVPVKRASMADAEWKKVLTPEEYYIIREDGTEGPFTSPLDKETRAGTYYSVDCGVPLFRSEQKYDSGTGWPSFWAPISPDVVTLQSDDSIPLEPRTEVRDAACDGHLGHVFDDGPPPTGKRYCMNGVALRFVPDAPAK